MVAPLRPFGDGDLEAADRASASSFFLVLDVRRELFAEHANRYLALYSVNIGDDRRISHDMEARSEANREGFLHRPLDLPERMMLELRTKMYPLLLARINTKAVVVE